MRKNIWPAENEELIKLRKLVQTKEDRILQLESNLIDLQKRYNEELQRKPETETL
jgi:hypothetical protein